MSQNISKALVNCTRLRNKFPKNSSAEHRFAYNPQRNFCVCLIRKKLPFLDKGATRVKCNLVNDDQIIYHPRKVSSIFNESLLNIFSSLNIPQYEDPLLNSENIIDPIENLSQYLSNSTTVIYKLILFQNH